MRRTVLVAVLLWSAIPLHAQESMQMPAKPCPAASVPLPAELAGWQRRASVTAARSPNGLAAATLVVGKGADIALSGTPDVTYPVRPAHPGGSVSYGGLVRFSVAGPGTYRVALGSGAWIDVVGNGQPVTSSAHGHGPDCSGIRKMVDFPLAPGAYVLEIAGNGMAQLPVLVTRLP